jgi:hypothetical protein
MAPLKSTPPSKKLLGSKGITFSLNVIRDDWLPLKYKLASAVHTVTSESLKRRINLKPEYEPESLSPASSDSYEKTSPKKTRLPNFTRGFCECFWCQTKKVTKQTHKRPHNGAKVQKVREHW